MAIPYTADINKNKGLVDFVVVGASKSGTTALHHYLDRQSGICLPRIKETNFFGMAGDAPEFQGPLDNESINRFSITSVEKYKSQFDFSEPETLRGEVCPFYLYSKSAANRIFRYARSAKIVMILRNPVTRAFSNYLHLIRDGREVLGFADAFSQCEERISANWEWFWDIKGQGQYYQQVKRYFEVFPKENILVLTYEEFCRDNLAALNRILKFIGADIGVNAIDNQRHNVSGAPYPVVKPLYNLLMRPGSVNSALRRMLPENLRKQLSGLLKRGATRSVTLSSEIAQELFEYYSDDIRCLEGLLGKDLSVWWATAP